MTGWQDGDWRDERLCKFEQSNLQNHMGLQFYDGAHRLRRWRLYGGGEHECGRVGFSHEPPRTEEGAVLGGRVLHIACDTPWGSCLRSHFYLGQDLPSLGANRQDLERACPDELGRALLQHCYNEFTFLARFLPSLFLGENRARIGVELPW